jgi:hypothetical protein
MIPMSAEEIKEFWHGFCERQRIGEALRAKGDTRITQDPEFWADRTMWQLLEEISPPGSAVEGRPKQS